MRSLLNPWVILALIVLLGGTATASYLRGRHDEATATLAQIALEQRVIDAAERGAAKGVSGLKVTNTYVKGKVETITREVPVYRDCRHDPAVLGLLNDLLSGKTSVPAGDRIVPAAEPAR